MNGNSPLHFRREINKRRLELGMARRKLTAPSHLGKGIILSDQRVKMVYLSTPDVLALAGQFRPDDLLGFDESIIAQCRSVGQDPEKLKVQADLLKLA
jgi:hypothetical protein